MVQETASPLPWARAERLARSVGLCQQADAIKRHWYVLRCFDDPCDLIVEMMSALVIHRAARDGGDCRQQPREGADVGGRVLPDLIE